MKKEYADFSENKGITINNFIRKDMGEDSLYAGVCTLNIEKVETQKIVSINGSDRIFIDVGYKIVKLYPKKENYIIISYFNNNYELVGICFDIVKTINYEAKMPYTEDLMLDIILTDKKEIVFVNENELNESFKNKKIKTEDYNLAKRTADKIVNRCRTGEQLEEIRQISLKCIGQ